MNRMSITELVISAKTSLHGSKWSHHLLTWYEFGSLAESKRLLFFFFLHQTSWKELMYLWVPYYRTGNTHLLDFAGFLTSNPKRTSNTHSSTLSFAQCFLTGSKRCPVVYFSYSVWWSLHLANVSTEGKKQICACVVFHIMTIPHTPGDNSDEQLYTIMSNL